MSDDSVGMKNQEIDLILTDSEGVIKTHKKVIFKNQIKSEIIMEV
jgi:hypothetical protein